jgi:DNA helicase II / ATP-dependent DNA helicase PcrA
MAERRRNEGGTNFMAQIAQLIGGAGTGKTTELLNVMDGVIERGLDPRNIGFCSFTRAARREASSRAADKYHLARSDLEEDGWFRTLHSVCFRALGVRDELITGTKADRDWLAGYLNGGAPGGEGMAQDFADPFAGQDNDEGKALAIWDAARNRMCPYNEAWERCYTCDQRTPNRDFCRDVVGKYEQAKRLDARLDFTDLLGLFSGVRFGLDGYDSTDPRGEAPDLPVWFFDEAQDASPLLHQCELRLIGQPSVRWVYVCGDPFQSIYGWAGADPRCFLDEWPACKRRTMPKSHRCAAPILAAGENVLRRCSDYFDRNIEPAEHAGRIEEWRLDFGLGDLVDPRDEWLILARTNLLASRLASQLDAAYMPWLPTRGGGSWAAPVRNEAIAALSNLAAGAPIDGGEWQLIMKYIPAKIPEGALLAHGTKARFANITRDRAQDAHPWVPLDEIDTLGATPLFAEGIRSGVWRSWIEGADAYLTATQRWGGETANHPKVRVGTVHSAKGAEADNVAIYTTISGPCYRSAQDPAGFNEEQRVKYVALTRARRRLIILYEIEPKFSWSIEP